MEINRLPVGSPQKGPIKWIFFRCRSWTSHCVRALKPNRVYMYNQMINEVGSASARFQTNLLTSNIVAKSYRAEGHYTKVYPLIIWPIIDLRKCQSRYNYET